MSLLGDSGNTFGSLRLAVAVVRAVGLRRALLLRQLALGQRRSRIWMNVGRLAAGSVLVGAALWSLSTPTAARGRGPKPDRE